VKAITITGRLGQDPKLRTVASGDAVLNLNVAVKDRKKGPDGTWGDHTLWFDVTLFGKRAESLSRLLKKGMQVAATGEFGLREYTARDGVVKQQLEVIARDVEPLDRLDRADGAPAYGAPGGGARAPQQGAYRPPVRSADAKFAEDHPPDDSDIPF
jgi:single-strand DNA-binding protein